MLLPNDALLSPLDVIATGRLGTVVKKAPLLCSTDAQGRVQYIAIEWTGAS
jgi:tRNA splicing endonuclease